jgi:hypothetical protein
MTEEPGDQGREVGEMSPRASPPANTSLRERWLTLARVVWVAVALLTVGVFVLSIPSEFARLQSPCTDTVSCSWLLRLTAENARELGELGVSVNFFAAYLVSLEAAFTIAPIAVGAIIFWRRPDDRMTFLVSLVLLMYWAGITFPYHLLELPRLWEALSAVVALIGVAAILLFMYVFPDGHFVPSWARWLALVSIAVFAPSILFPYSLLSLWRHPLLNAFVSAAVFGAIVLVQAYRYKRVSDATQRQQTKWVVLGIVAAAVGYCMFPVLNLLQGGVLVSLLGYTAALLLLVLLMLSIVVAVLRYRLYDIDLIINRTLVYGTLTALLVAVYVGSVVSLQAALRGLTGQESQLAIVASTLLIAALFNPLRRRTQAFVDRRFYRSKYDAAKTLSAFNARLRDETDLDALNAELVEVVRETMQPAHVTLWLRPEAASNEDVPATPGGALLRRLVGG